MPAHLAGLPLRGWLVRLALWSARSSLGESAVASRSHVAHLGEHVLERWENAARRSCWTASGLPARRLSVSAFAKRIRAIAARHRLRTTPHACEGRSGATNHLHAGFCCCKMEKRSWSKIERMAELTRKECGFPDLGCCVRQPASDITISLPVPVSINVHHRNNLVSALSLMLLDPCGSTCARP